MRERPGLTQAEITKVRITPARAGKTTLSGYEYAYAQDHPRSCGKDHVLLWVLVLVSGSPPLVRERPLGGFGVRAGARITPARAGKTIPCRPKSWPAQDHPRSCGKDLKDDFQTKCGKGSPPLVRERLALGDVDVVFVGITPARAGKTHMISHRDSLPRDHPRSCGKDKHYLRQAVFEQGSPPLVRERQ